jgi:SCY1-like protein 2
MFAAATSFFSRSNISQNYTIGGPSTASRAATPVSGAGATSSALPTPANVPPFQVGPWRVQSATHRVTGKRVSVWTFDKKSAEVDRLSPMARDKSMDVLKAEVRCIREQIHMAPAANVFDFYEYVGDVAEQVKASLHPR